jgi:integrase
LKDVDQVPRRITPALGDAVSQYLVRRELDLGRQTLRSYRVYLGSLVKSVGPKRVIGQMPSQLVIDWLFDQRRRGLSPGSVNNAHTVVNGFNDWCLDRPRRWVSETWLDGVPLEPVPERDWIRLTATQAMTLVDAIEDARDHVLVALGVYTALRVNELTALTVSDVDLSPERPMLRLRLSKQRARVPVIRYHPITAELATELAAWLQTYREQAGELKPDWLLAPAKRRGTVRYHAATQGVIYTPGSLNPTGRITNPRSIIRRAYDAAGYNMPAREGWHTLRRSSARLYFDSCLLDGDPYASALRRTAALLHHKHTSTTERYLGLDADRAARDRDLSGQPFLSRLAQSDQKYADVISLADRRR